MGTGLALLLCAGTLLGLIAYTLAGWGGRTMPSTSTIRAVLLVWALVAGLLFYVLLHAGSA